MLVLTEYSLQNVVVAVVKTMLQVIALTEFFHPTSAAAVEAQNIPQVIVHMAYFHLINVLDVEVRTIAQQTVRTVYLAAVVHRDKNLNLIHHQAKVVVRKLLVGYLELLLLYLL